MTPFFNAILYDDTIFDFTSRIFMVLDGAASWLIPGLIHEYVHDSGCHSIMGLSLDYCTETAVAMMAGYGKA